MSRKGKCKKRVLVLTSTFPRWRNDTTPPFVFELSKHLAKSLDITVLTPHCYKSKLYETMDGLEVYRYRYFLEQYEKLAGSGGILPTIRRNRLYILQIPFFIFFQIVSTVRLVRKIKPDIIHAHWIIPQGITALIIKKWFDIPYIVTSHGSDLHSTGFIGLKRIILKNAKTITVVSSYLAKEVEKINKKLLEKTQIIPMGVDTTLFNPNKYDKSIKTKYGITGPFLLFIGRLVPEKGVVYLIDAMPAILKKYPKTKLMIIGGGTLEKELKDQTKKLKIESNIIFLGSVKHDDLPPYYATADIFVSPSIKEGMPSTYIEALSCGTYLIVGDIPVSKDIIKNIKIGLLTKANPKNISKTILYAFENKNYYKKHNSLNQIYSWTNIFKQFNKLFL